MGDLGLRLYYFFLLSMAFNQNVSSRVSHSVSEQLPSPTILAPKSSSTSFNGTGNAIHPLKTGSENASPVKETGSSSTSSNDHVVKVIDSRHMQDIKQLPEMTEEQAHAIEENHNLTPDLIRNPRQPSKREEPRTDLKRLQPQTEFSLFHTNRNTLQKRSSKEESYFGDQNSENLGMNSGRESETSFKQDTFPSDETSEIQDAADENLQTEYGPSDDGQETEERPSQSTDVQTGVLSEDTQAAGQQEESAELAGHTGGHDNNYKETDMSEKQTTSSDVIENENELDKELESLIENDLSKVTDTSEKHATTSDVREYERQSHKEPESATEGDGDGIGPIEKTSESSVARGYEESDLSQVHSPMDNSRGEDTQSNEELESNLEESDEDEDTEGTDLLEEEPSITNTEEDETLSQSESESLTEENNEDDTEETNLSEEPTTSDTGEDETSSPSESESLTEENIEDTEETGLSEEESTTSNEEKDETSSTSESESMAEENNSSEFTDTEPTSDDRSSANTFESHDDEISESTDSQSESPEITDEGPMDESSDLESSNEDQATQPISDDTSLTSENDGLSLLSIGNDATKKKSDISIALSEVENEDAKPTKKNSKHKRNLDLSTSALKAVNEDIKHHPQENKPLSESDIQIESEVSTAIPLIENEAMEQAEIMTEDTSNEKTDDEAIVENNPESEEKKSPVEIEEGTEIQENVNVLKENEPISESDTPVGIEVSTAAPLIENEAMAEAEVETEADTSREPIDDVSSIENVPKKEETQSLGKIEEGSESQENVNGLNENEPISESDTRVGIEVSTVVPLIENEAMAEAEVATETDTSREPINDVSSEENVPETEETESPVELEEGTDNQDADIPVKPDVDVVEATSNAETDEQEPELETNINTEEDDNEDEQSNKDEFKPDSSEEMDIEADSEILDGEETGGEPGVKNEVPEEQGHDNVGAVEKDEIDNLNDQQNADLEVTVKGDTQSVPHTKHKHIKAEIELGTELKNMINKALEKEVPAEGETHARWSAWSDWTACSASCGSEGLQGRRRACVMEPCVDEDSEKRECYNQPPCTAPVQVLPPRPVIVSQWSDWGSWSACSVTCGMGGEVRTRDCMSPECIGATSKSRHCIRDACKTFDRESPVQGAPGHAAKLHCLYDKNLPVKDLYWVSPTGHVIRASARNPSFSLRNDYLYIWHARDYDQGTYHCVVVRPSGKTDTGDATLRIDSCKGRNLCLNGGTCVSNSISPDRTRVTCFCPAGLDGPRCENKEDSVIITVVIVLVVVFATSQLLGLGVLYWDRYYRRSSKKRPKPKVGKFRLKSWLRRNRKSQEAEREPLLDGASPPDGEMKEGESEDIYINDEPHYYEVPAPYIDETQQDFQPEQDRRRSAPAFIRRDTPHPKKSRRYSLPEGSLQENSQLQNPLDLQQGFPERGSRGIDDLEDGMDQHQMVSQSSDVNGKRVSFSDIREGQVMQGTENTREVYDYQSGSWIMVTDSNPENGNHDFYRLPPGSSGPRNTKENAYLTMENYTLEEDPYVTMDSSRYAPHSNQLYDGGQFVSTVQGQPQMMYERLPYEGHVVNNSHQHHWGSPAKDPGFGQHSYTEPPEGTDNVYSERPKPEMFPESGSLMWKEKDAAAYQDMSNRQIGSPKFSPRMNTIRAKISRFIEAGAAGAVPNNANLSPLASPGGEPYEAQPDTPPRSAPRRPYSTWSPGGPVPQGPANMPPAALQELSDHLLEHGLTPGHQEEVSSTRSPALRLFTGDLATDENVNNGNDCLDASIEEGDRARFLLGRLYSACAKADANSLHEGLESLDLSKVNLGDPEMF